MKYSESMKLRRLPLNRREFEFPLRTAIIAAAMSLAVESVCAQEPINSDSDTSQQQVESAIPETTPKRLLRAIKGTPTADGLLFLPIGWHPNNTSTDDGISSIDLFAISKKSLTGGTFINSFDDRVWFIGVTRTLYKKKRFGFDYSAGLMVGYDGNLAPSINGPLKPLFEGNLNPYFAVSPYYQISERLELRLLAAPPNIVAFGIKLLF